MSLTSLLAQARIYQFFSHFPNSSDLLCMMRLAQTPQEELFFLPWLYFDLYLCLDLLCECKDLSILWSLAQDTFPTMTSVVSQNNIDGKRQGFLWWGKQDRKRVGAEPEPTPIALHFSVCSGYTSSQWWFTPTIVKPWRISLRNIKIPKVSNFLDKANSHRESFSKQWIVF